MFRLKIAMLSVLLSGIVLVGLGLYSLSVMNKIGLARIDQEILSLGEGHLAIGPPRGYWQNFETSLQFIYSGERSDSLIVQIKDPGHEVLYQSAHWPAEITEDSFPGFDHVMEHRPQPPLEKTGGDRGHKPPREAYEACEGKSPGSLSQFVNPSGEIIQGACENDNGGMVLRPHVNRHGRQVRADEGPGGRPSSPGAIQPDKPMPRIKTPVFATIQTASGAWRTGIMGSERITMMVGVNLAGYYVDAARYRGAFLSIVPIALLLLAAGGWLIAQRALKPVVLITRTAEAITARALDQRIPAVAADRELSRLVDVINSMLDRLEKSFGQAIRFSADAAHDLQTPLTILQGELDDAVQHAPIGSEEQLRASGLLEEVQQLKAIVQKLLILARTDAGKLDLRLEDMNLSALIETAAEDAEALAAHLKIEKQIAPGVRVRQILL